MEARIRNHITNHRVPADSLGAIMVFYPKGLRNLNQSFMNSIARRSVNAYADNFGESTGMFFNAWATNTSELIPSLQSIPNHFSCNSTSMLHVFFVSHGVPAHVIWSREKHVNVSEILKALSDLNFSQLKSVSFLSCNTLKNHIQLNVPFDLVGFSNFVYWNEMPFFLARVVKELSAGATVKQSLRIAVRCCNCNRKTPMKLQDLVYLPMSNKKIP